MDNDKAIVIFNIEKRNEQALNEAYKLEIDTSNIKNCYLKSENPIALLRGNKTLAEYGIRNGTLINFTE